MRLIGSKKSTGKLPLLDIKHYLEGGIKSDTHLDLIVATEHSLGDVEVVILSIDGKFTNHYSWFVDFTIVYDCFKNNCDDRKTVFPCYHWIKGNSSVATTAHSSKESCIAI